MAWGYGASSPEIEAGIQTGELKQLKFFKLHLRPQASADDKVSNAIPPLPKPVVDVYADYYRCLFEEAKQYVLDTHAWSLDRMETEFIISIPNGWTIAEQTQIRCVAKMIQVQL